jgi:acyl-CoA reductase-like NAD-dependent aldehyde dehydrogenase
MRTVDPTTGNQIAHYDEHSDSEVDDVLGRVADAQRGWAARDVGERAAGLRRMGDLLRTGRERHAALITAEMGKPHAQAVAEVEKCAWVCDHYADHAAGLLADQAVDMDEGQAYVQQLPLGVVLAVMPWNFPFWQVFRAVAPILAAGNAVVLKHAENVTGCGLAIERIVAEAGLGDDVVRTVLLPGKRVSALMSDDRIAAATLTGSERAGASLAGNAGENLKTTVLELGGSDAFIVLDDADVARAAEVAVTARFQNTGQSCIAAKRFIVVDSVADEFVERFVAGAEALTMGAPTEASTDLGPLARHDLRDDLAGQVTRSVDAGARVLTGGRVPDGSGAFYPATVLEVDDTTTAVMREETFGPVAAILRVADEDAAVDAANDSTFGLSSSLWTADLDRARRLTRRIHAGGCFVNAMTASDPRLPFGGVKRSGYGRELAWLGIREFTNAQTVRLVDA